MTFNIQAGDICVLPFPFTDLTTHKKRPALALSAPDEYGDIRFVFITTKSGHKDISIKIEAPDYLVGCQPLPRDSYIRLEKQYLLNKSLVLSKKTSVSPEKLEEILRSNIIKEITPYCDNKYQDTRFQPGVTAVPVSGKVIGEPEIAAITESALDGWLTTGRFNDAFEKRFADFVGVPYALTTNSGSSANLLAVAALTSPKLGSKALKAGDEVITVAAGFPTTVNPILQMGMVPVFVDVNIPTYNIDTTKIEAAISSKTRAIVLAHTLGNPFDLETVMSLADKYNLWVIEDCCDALGSTYKGQHVGTFGHIATCSFYPAHHITTGEGGMVFTADRKLKKIIESFRDWGRDCYCAPGFDDTCGMRYGWQLGDLPKGYDHKYIYSHLGFNLKMTDMQAACGLVQMDKLPEFIIARKRNFDYLVQQLKSLENIFVLPKTTTNSEASWFGFPLTIRSSTGIERVELLKFLAKHKIHSRLLFAGNLVRQPYMATRKYRVNGSLDTTDLVMSQTFWLGLYPGLTVEMLDFVYDRLTAFIKGY